MEYVKRVKALPNIYMAEHIQPLLILTLRTAKSYHMNH
jgi:hypothetical protein